MRAVQDQRAEIRERAEHALSGQAATIAETVAHELLVIDQSLTVIQEAWKTDSDAVDLEKWQQQMPALLAVADDLFIADDKHVIRQDILPKAIGQGIGSAYVTFPHGSLEQFQSDGTKRPRTRWCFCRDRLSSQADRGAPVPDVYHPAAGSSERMAGRRLLPVRGTDRSCLPRRRWATTPWSR